MSNTQVYLENAEQQAKKFPSTFHIPARSARTSLRVGDLVKVVFSADPLPKSGASGERMWLIVETVKRGGDYVGALDNKPSQWPWSAAHRVGDLITFGPENVIDIVKAGEGFPESEKRKAKRGNLRVGSKRAATPIKRATKKRAAPKRRKKATKAASPTPRKKRATARQSAPVRRRRRKAAPARPPAAAAPKKVAKKKATKKRAAKRKKPAKRKKAATKARAPKKTATKKRAAPRKKKSPLIAPREPRTRRAQQSQTSPIVAPVRHLPLERAPVLEHDENEAMTFDEWLAATGHTQSTQALIDAWSDGEAPGSYAVKHDQHAMTDGRHALSTSRAPVRLAKLDPAERAQRLLDNGYHVIVKWSESGEPSLREGARYPSIDAFTGALRRAQRLRAADSGGYDKTAFVIEPNPGDTSELGTYEGRYDLQHESREGKADLARHIRTFLESAIEQAEGTTAGSPYHLTQAEFEDARAWIHFLDLATGRLRPIETLAANTFARAVNYTPQPTTEDLLYVGESLGRGLYASELARMKATWAELYAASQRPRTPPKGSRAENPAAYDRLTAKIDRETRDAQRRAKAHERQMKATSARKLNALIRSAPAVAASAAEKARAPSVMEKSLRDKARKTRLYSDFFKAREDIDIQDTTKLGLERLYLPLSKLKDGRAKGTYEYRGQKYVVEGVDKWIDFVKGRQTSTNYTDGHTPHKLMRQLRDQVEHGLKMERIWAREREQLREMQARKGS